MFVLFPVRRGKSQFGLDGRLPLVETVLAKGDEFEFSGVLFEVAFELDRSPLGAEFNRTMVQIDSLVKLLDIVRLKSQTLIRYALNHRK